MFRLILFILVCVVFLGFIVLNMHHTSDISFGFAELNDIPVFLSILCSFLLGTLFAIPLAFAMRRKKTETPKSAKKQGKTAELEEIRPDEINKEKSPYGID